jgi:2-keto-4-pentenoate hydratase
MMTGVQIDQRIIDGLREQLARRDELIRGGERQIGWKVGFAAPAALDKLGTDRPLVGYLLESARLEDGAEVSIGDWTAPALEPEIAVHLAADVPPGAAWPVVRDAIAGLSAAIELADVSPPPEDPREILAGNIYQRHVMLGPVDTSRQTAEGIGGRVERDGEEIAANDDPASLTGEVVEVVRLTGELLEAVGERLRAGQVVITGSAVPPVQVAPGQDVTVELGPLGRLTVRLRD